MVPKPVYEVLPVLYASAAVLTLVLNDSVLRYFPASLLLFTSLVILYLRYQFRHLTPRERAVKIAQKYRARYSQRAR